MYLKPCQLIVQTRLSLQQTIVPLPCYLMKHRTLVIVNWTVNPLWNVTIPFLVILRAYLRALMTNYATASTFGITHKLEWMSSTNLKFGSTFIMRKMLIHQTTRYSSCWTAMTAVCPLTTWKIKAEKNCDVNLLPYCTHLTGAAKTNHCRWYNIHCDSSQYFYMSSHKIQKQATCLLNEVNPLN